MPTTARFPALLGAALLTACASDPASPPDASTSDGAVSDVAADAGAADAGFADVWTASACTETPASPYAARSNLPVGSVLWLPRAEAEWTLREAPMGNRNAPFRDEASGRWGFVAHLPGSYAFAAGSQTVTAQAVAASSLAFHNHNYFPTRALSVSGAQLLVAAVIRPELLVVDASTLAVTQTVPVGAWPVAVAATDALAFVASRGEDVLTVVDRATGRPTRAVWIGDEVSNVALTPDGRTLIALAPIEREAVFVDVATLRVTARVRVGVDPTHLVVAPDGSRAWVAGRRTGVSSLDDESDLVELSVAMPAVSRRVQELGTTLGGLAVSADGRTVYASGVRNNARGSLSDERTNTFQHTVIALDVSGPTVREALVRDITRSLPMGVTEAAAQAPTTPERALELRRPVGLAGLVRAGDTLYVLSEASDMLLALDAATLTERARTEVPGRPRALEATPEGRVVAFGHQSLRVTAVQSTGTTLMARSSDGLANDPRPEPVAAGMRFFTGTGIRAPVGFGSTNFIGGDTWSCSACHVDGLSDRMIWQAGPVPTHRYTSRGFTMLEGTWPLGWQGYLADVRNYAYTVTTNIGIYRPTQTQVDTLAAYLASIQAPPPENSLTERDGAHSAEACRGAQVYARYCESCHTGALSTSRERVERSILDRQRADIPSLLGSYRLGVWYRKGGASTLSDAVGQMAEWVGATLVPDDRAALVRYVGELTGRNLAVVTTYPRPDALLAADGHVDVVMTHALVNAPDNLARVRLLDDAGAPIAAEVTRVEPRRLRIVPRAALPFGATVRVELGAGLASERDLATRAAERMTYRVVAAPAVRVEGRYRVMAEVPAFGPPGTPPPAPSQVDFDLQSTPGGTVTVRAVYPNGIVYRWEGAGLLSGRRLVIPPVPIPVGPATADGFSGFVADVADTTGDGVADEATAGTGEAGRRVYTLAGPGFEYPTQGFTLTRMGATAR